MEVHTLSTRSPDMAIAAFVKSLTTILHFVFKNNASQPKLRPAAARGTLRTYTIMRAIAQEGIRMMAALAAPWQTDLVMITEVMMGLEEQLRVLSVESQLSDIQIGWHPTKTAMYMPPLNLILPSVISASDLFLPHSFDIPTHPSTTTATNKCFDKEVTQFRDSLHQEYPMVLQQQVPFVTENPFPSFNILPLPIGHYEDDINDRLIFMPDINGAAAIISWVTRALVAMAHQTSAIDKYPLSLCYPAFTGDYTMYSYGHMRTRLCNIMDDLILPKIAHPNENTLHVIQRILAFLESGLKAAMDTVGYESLYNYARGADIHVSPANIKANEWMPRLIFHSIYTTPHHDEPVPGQNADGWARLDTEWVLMTLPLEAYEIE